MDQVLNIYVFNCHFISEFVCYIGSFEHIDSFEVFEIKWRFGSHWHSPVIFAVSMWNGKPSFSLMSISSLLLFHACHVVGLLFDFVVNGWSSYMVTLVTANQDCLYPSTASHVSLMADTVQSKAVSVTETSHVWGIMFSQFIQKVHSFVSYDPWICVSFSIKLAAFM